MPRRRLAPALGAAAAALALPLAACAPDGSRTALAPREMRWLTPTQLVVEVECADDIEATVEVWGGVSLLPLVTIWGTPNREGCWTPVSLTMPLDADHLHDAASGGVIALPPRPAA